MKKRDKNIIYRHRCYYIKYLKNSIPAGEHSGNFYPSNNNNYCVEIHYECWMYCHNKK
ncbi:hypothetical protein CE11_01196 [Megavirus courdo11]|uniref:Uncharacterized protein n=2 Tax=Megavirus TaxID=3044761 RepID=K7YGL2_9VIRU|nr:hypothetical protein c7_L1319 [Megavirus courdo7]AFX93222.1 hypothetical protein CE11_01196 [Megavirus courdo11]WBF70183.1 hypothetical protein [Megavirus caiporensis]